MRDGVRGGTEGAIYQRWVKDCADYNTHVDTSMRHARFLQIKRCIKLNNNEATPKRGESGYDPAYKYDFIWDVLVHNVNAISKSAGQDLAGDETSWGHQGYAETGAGLSFKILNKPGV